MTNARKALNDYERSLMPNNSSSSSASATGGIGVFGLLTAILLVFKLAGMAGVSWGLANLSWFWVFAPLLAGFLLFFVIMAVLIIFAIVLDR